MTPAPLWRSAATECALCGGRRRDYLFVVGGTRMTRCHECGLISRTGSEAPVDSPSYALDADADARIRAALPAGRLLEVRSGGVELSGDPRLQVVAVDPSTGLGALESTEPRSFDAAFVNGVVESVADPVALLRKVAACLRPGGSLLLAVGAGDLEGLPSDGPRLPQHVFSPATLLRLARAAGLRSEACGLLTRSPGTPAKDERLCTPAPFPGLSRLAKLLGRPMQVSAGLLELRAVAAEPAQRPKLSILMPVFNEAATFADTFERVYGASIEGLDRELIVVESNSTDGSRALVQAVAGRPGVRALYEERPRGKGHAVRAGLALATGDIILIQDADSEYDVADYDIVLEPLLRLTATFVLGSRHMGGRTWKIRQFGEYGVLAHIMNLAHVFFTGLLNWLYGVETRDPTTMYKVFRRECAAGIRFRRDRFDFDFELVCKLIRRGHIPVEVPINYRARGYSEGKKVRFFRDPVTWLRTIVSSRFESLF